MTTYRFTSPRSRTDRAAEVMWAHLIEQSRPTSSGLRGLNSHDAHLVDVVRLRARQIRPETREQIDAVLKAAGVTPLRYTTEREGHR